ncbi:hypothetical protein HMN09_00799300 [Mycena chlorophos]|uniref:Terpenoid synthase n=1 Tax=Mycena chlorophos TaxID=658473 RepID=A0A8H6SU12_MYCCL|nr:hypothetical protein HMN09_00799300 [Mycena chlorophos]
MPTTASVQLPDFLSLARAFSLRTNRHCHSVAVASEQAWSSLLSDDERARLPSLKLGLWAAVCFPTCDQRQLRLATDFLTALVLSASRTTTELFDEVVPRILPAMPSDVARDTLLRLFQEFQAARLKTTVPDIATYVELRRASSGIPMLLSLLEMAEGLRPNADAVQLKHLAADVIALSLDVFAYNNARLAGNQLNFVSVIQAEKGVSVQGAMNYAFSHVQRAFQDLQAALGPVGPEPASSAWDWLTTSRKTATSSPIVDDETRLYVRGLQDCIAGSLNWAYETELFFGTKGDDVRQYGWVFLS